MPSSNNTREDSTHGHDQMVKQNQTDYILCRQRSRSSIHSENTWPGPDCGSNHELLITKFRLKWKKIGTTTRPFRYDLNQIPYFYRVEVTTRFKELDLIERVPEELWIEVHIQKTMDGDSWYCTGVSDQDHSQDFSWEIKKKQNGCLRRLYK